MSSEKLVGEKNLHHSTHSLLDSSTQPSLPTQPDALPLPNAPSLPEVIAHQGNTNDISLAKKEEDGLQPLRPISEEKGGFGWVRSLFIRIIATLLVAAGLWYSIEGLSIVVILFILVVPFEKLFPRHEGQKVRRPHLGTDISYALVSPLMAVGAGFVAIIIGVISLAWIPGLLLKPYVAMIPAAYAPFVGFVIFDIIVYWTHRFYHEIPVLWKFHAIHHSTEHLDWASGFRGHPFDGTLAAPAFFFLIAAGFTAEMTGVFAALQIVVGLFLHANVKWRLKWLHAIVITPEFHHWHHTKDEEAIWTNYSVFFPLWDIIFGTYFMPKNRRPENYGVDEYIPDGIVEQLRYPLRGIGNPFWAIRHPFKAIGVTYRFTKKILGEMKRSAFRPRGSYKVVKEKRAAAKIAARADAES